LASIEVSIGERLRDSTCYRRRELSSCLLDVHGSWLMTDGLGVSGEAIGPEERVRNRELCSWQSTSLSSGRPNVVSPPRQFDHEPSTTLCLVQSLDLNDLRSPLHPICTFATSITDDRLVHSYSFAPSHPRNPSLSHPFFSTTSSALQLRTKENITTNP
jgi:hypothetical protein